MERRGEQQEMAVVLFKLALALHMSLRFAEADETYRRAFDLWTPPSAPAEGPTATLRVATSFLPNDNDPKSAIAWPNIQLCMQLFDRLVEAWPERTIVPSLAERWEIAPDGLRYVFHLREGLRWSDGEPLTAHDVEFGIKRVLDPASPGSSVAIYFVLENGQDYYLGRNTDADRIGVRALDDRTVEFRLVAPAPYFMGVMNRPDGGPQPRHAVERDRDGWVDPERQVVSGAFRIAARGASGELGPRGVRAGPRLARAGTVRERRTGYGGRPVHAADRGPHAPGASRRPPRSGGVVRVSCVRPHGRTDVRPRPAEGARPRRGPCGAGEGGAGEHGPGHRGDRAARAPGPHAGHRPAVRTGPGEGAPGPVEVRRRADRGGSGGPRLAVRARAGLVARGPRSRGGAANVDPGGRGIRAAAHRARADLLHRMAPRLRRPRVLPPAAVPVRQPHERGRVLLAPVRRAHRTREE